jgi:hypothetical protein
LTRLAAHDARGRRQCCGRKPSEPIGELNWGELVVWSDNCFMGINHKGPEMFWSV